MIVTLSWWKFILYKAVIDHVSVISGGGDKTSSDQRNSSVWKSSGRITAQPPPPQDRSANMVGFYYLWGDLLTWHICLLVIACYRYFAILVKLHRQYLSYGFQNVTFLCVNCFIDLFIVLRIFYFCTYHSLSCRLFGIFINHLFGYGSLGQK